MRTWVNGRILDDVSTPALAVNDHAVTVGDGVFEAIKIVDDVPFAVTRHLARLGRSAASLGLPAPDLHLVREAITATIAGQSLPLGRIRITYSAGPSPLGSPRGDGPPSLIVTSAAADAYDGTTSICTVRWPRNERGVLAGVKSTSYAENVVALAKATEAGASEAIFANLQGNLCEGTGSNIFYVVDGQVRTPSLASGCLAGVTRDLLLEWYDVVEIDEPIGILGSADEIFLTSTVRNVQGVERCDDRELVAPGPVTDMMMEVWAEREAADVDP